MSSPSPIPLLQTDTRDSGSIPGLGRFPWRRVWQPKVSVLPGESHGQRSLVGYGPRCPKESDTTEATQHVCAAHRQLPSLVLPCWSTTNQAKSYRTEGCLGLSGSYVLVCLAGPVQTPVEPTLLKKIAYLCSRGLLASHAHSRHLGQNPARQSWGFKCYINH